MEEFDYVVIGAGPFGLGAAKQLRCLNPGSSLAVFEGESSLGGTWASHRLYPGLKSNNLLGTYEYPDFPMDPKKFGVKPGEHIPGEVIHAYLTAYVTRFDILPLIRFNSRVTVAEHQDTQGGWQLTVTDSITGAESHVHARHLVVASGLTSEPRPIPDFKGQESFGAPIFHGKDFLDYKHTIEQGKTVTVFAGSKLAWDAVYTYATAGVRVNWVIRESGRGPIWQAPPFVTPLKRWIEELANTRFLTWFSPCIWGHADGYSTIRHLLHRTFIGRLLVGAFWNILMGDVLSLNRYDSHPKTAKLKPWDDVMSTATSFSLLNYDTDIWDVIKSDLVNVYIGEIDRLSPRKVHLSDGTELEADALLAHTGWRQRPQIKFLPQGIEKELGIIGGPGNIPSELVTSDQQSLLDEADAAVVEQLPILAKTRVQPPAITPKAEKGPQEDTNSFMLYHLLVPPSERFLRSRDVAFVGFASNFSNVIMAHIQGLWVSAYFNRRLSRDPGSAVGDEEALAEIRRETVLHNRYGKWRYPVDWGSDKAPSFIFDAVPYFDLLLRDLGLAWRRKGGLWREMWSAYKPGDYRTVNEEWTDQVQASRTD